MEIPYCPVIRPTLKEFENFKEFVEKLDRLYKHTHGIVKVTNYSGKLLSSSYSLFFIYSRLSHHHSGKPGNHHTTPPLKVWL